MKDNESSSLELLLDTMCNTFGGVMFIAITLAVVLFSQKALQNQIPPEEKLNQQKQELLQQMQNLRKMLEEQIKTNQKNQQIFLALQQDPRLKLMSQIVATQRLIKNEDARKNLIAKELHFLDAECLSQNNQYQKMTEIQKEQDKQILALLAHIKSQNKIIAQLSQEIQTAVPLSMTFTTLHEYKNTPSYYLLIKDGKIWRIGPTQSHDLNGIPIPEEDVDYKIIGNSVLCIPKEEAGVPVLQGKEPSPELQEILSQIPKNRGPHFYLTKEDAELFYTLRETLKSQNIFHGFEFHSDKNIFGYSITPGATYEY